MPPAKKAAAKTPAKKTTARKGASTGRPTKKAASTPKKGVAAVSPSMSMIRVGKYDYPLVTSARCHTCQSPHRRWIENELLMARSYASIAERLLEMEQGTMPAPSAASLTAHVKDGHTPTPARIRRQIVDRRVEDLGSAIAGEESLVDHVIINDLILQRGYERLMNGEIEPDAADLQRAILTRMKIEETSPEGYDAEAFQSAILAYMETAMKFIPQEHLEAYGRELNRHPILLALRRKQIEASTIDVESDED